MPKSSQPKRRGAVSVRTSKLLTVWMPRPLVEAIDAAVARNDTDRSKWIRQAIREKAAREGSK